MGKRYGNCGPNLTTINEKCIGCKYFKSAEKISSSVFFFIESGYCTTTYCKKDAISKKENTSKRKDKK